MIQFLLCQSDAHNLQGASYRCSRPHNAQTFFLEARGDDGTWSPMMYGLPDLHTAAQITGTSMAIMVEGPHPGSRVLLQSRVA